MPKATVKNRSRGREKRKLGREVTAKTTLDGPFAEESASYSWKFGSTELEDAAAGAPTVGNVDLYSYEKFVDGLGREFIVETNEETGKKRRFVLPPSITPDYCN
jgi:hypothetical protein